MKNAHNYHRLHIGLALLAGIVLFRHIWVWMPDQTYQHLRTDTALITAFSTANTDQISRLQKLHNFQYQVYKQGKLVKQTSSKLPLLKVIAQKPSAPGVLTAPVNDNLAVMQPYIVHMGVRRTVLFVLNGPAKSQTTYAIYKQAVL